MRIPEEVINAIRDRVSIVDVVGSHVALKRAGQAWKGLCPFHNEKTPSFTVNEERGTFKCFGCGKGGNAFTFLMEMEGRTFREAAEQLGGRAGVEIPRGEESQEDKTRRKEQDQIREVLELAGRYYRYQFTEGRAGEPARAYAERRGIGSETAEAFRVGCAPKGWDNLARYLGSKKIDLELAKRAGLVAKRESGGYYDRFRDRLMFPITDHAGRIVSFGGRVMGDDEPKYLNGPETEVFHKSRVLYGLFEGAQALRTSGRAVMVEGYMDVVILHEKGYPGCLATMGTALTREHVEAIRRRVDEAILVFDGDAAGRKAMERSLDIFLAEEYTCRAVAMPPGEDPDSFVGKGGDLATLLDEAPPLFDLVMHFVADRHNIGTVDGKIGAVSDLVPRLKAVRDELNRSEYIKLVAETLGIDETLLRRRMAATTTPGSRRAAEQGEPEMVEPVSLDPQERELVRLLLYVPSRRHEFLQSGAQLWLEPGPLREAATFIASREEPASAFPIEQAPEPLCDLLTGLVMEEVPGDNDDYSALAQVLERRALRHSSKRLAGRIAEAEKQGNWEEIARLIHEKEAIDRNISNT